MARFSKANNSTANLGLEAKVLLAAVKHCGNMNAAELQAQASNANLKGPGYGG
jgi:hypothetical protein